jgi:hypothetical protein
MLRPAQKVAQGTKGMSGLNRSGQRLLGGIGELARWCCAQGREAHPALGPVIRKYGS